jgi:hypothetical protein
MAQSPKLVPSISVGDQFKAFEQNENRKTSTEIEANTINQTLNCPTGQEGVSLRKESENLVARDRMDYASIDHWDEVRPIWQFY